MILMSYARRRYADALMRALSPATPPLMLRQFDDVEPPPGYVTPLYVITLRYANIGEMRRCYSVDVRRAGAICRHAPALLIFAATLTIRILRRHAVSYAL